MKHKTRLAILAIFIAIISPFFCTKVSAYGYFQNNGKHPRSIARSIKKHQKSDAKARKESEKKQQNKISSTTTSSS